MNVFFLSYDPVECAKSMVDKHVVKMILETAQLLSTAHRVLDGQETIAVQVPSGRKKKVWTLPDYRGNKLYQATHINHPSAVWARQSAANYSWLAKHLIALCEEYTYRYGKVHKVERDGLMKFLQILPKNIPHTIFYTPPSCMDTKYQISDNPVINYRNYYKYGKAHIHSWKDREPPAWISGETLCQTIHSKIK